MRTPVVPTLLTPGRIADELGASLPRVVYVLSTRRHILPAARAGTLRLYDESAVAQVRHELNGIDARRGGQGTASQTTRWERLKKWALNNWLVVAFLAILAVVVSLAALGSGLETLFNWMRRFRVWLWP